MIQEQKALDQQFDKHRNLVGCQVCSLGGDLFLIKNLTINLKEKKIYHHCNFLPLHREFASDFEQYKISRQSFYSSQFPDVVIVYVDSRQQNTTKQGGTDQ